MPDCICLIETQLGKLYQGDCIPWLKSLPSGSANLFFVDPPYNITKVRTIFM